MQNLTRFLNERKSRYQKKICRAEKQEKLELADKGAIPFS